ncbi:MAG: 50S ribosomal protein L44e [Nanoarchaeota archaeon]|nr:50S ribosomal protein L44e [Nanoarchaeota archaeon]
MKVPKKLKKYCPKCKAHKEMTISIVKQQGKNKVHPLSRGSKKRIRLRGGFRGVGNKGSFSRGAINKWKRYGAKKSKKVNLKLKCKDCGKSILLIGNRAKKVEVSHT